MFTLAVPTPQPQEMWEESNVNFKTNFPEAHEGRQTSAAGVSYTYDGDGKRVEKSNGKLYWFGANSDPLLETDLTGNLQNEYIFFGGKRLARRDSSGSVYYYFGDHLGTSRVITTNAGAICYDADFYPFGGERTITNTCAQNYKFTGKERDSETGNDYFGARFYESNLGRFMSVDPSRKSANPSDPQGWNRYAYTLNNPLAFVDRNGKWPTSPHFGTWTHGDIVDRAFPGLSRHQRQIIKVASALVDRDLSRAGAPAHGMTPYGGDRNKAASDSNKIVRDSEAAAQATQKQYADQGNKGLSDKALDQFSGAFHERTDETSPAHVGHQEWRGVGEGGFIEKTQEGVEADIHAIREATATDAEKQASVDAARQALKETFGQAEYEKAIEESKEEEKP
jgi:RHS repeat-associated protein